MQCNNVTTIPKGLLQLQGSLSSMMDSLYYDPKVAELMNTSMGQYLNGHPFLALAVLVFGAMATVPIGLFLAFATVTFIGATVGFILLEVFLLSLGGVSLLCVLSALAILAILVSLVLGACYITSSNVLNFYYSQRYQNTQPGVNTHTNIGPSLEILILSLSHPLPFSLSPSVSRYRVTRLAPATNITVMEQDSLTEKKMMMKKPKGSPRFKKLQRQ
ncbi:lipid droplet assembly factor 1 isoform X1 [Coregonus clupeaformis]|uniref:lipid droplet assembly factor 1 isoform X1 n=1 Tax=Coregonus clupeaformis TaxID=59861 RepID=UPI001BDF82E4|nr:lipid droplet assembly factor 1 isoform X1 [Coregonus clupeaformis]